MVSKTQTQIDPYTGVIILPTQTMRYDKINPSNLPAFVLFDTSQYE